MKKVLVICLVCVMIFALVACGKQTPAKTTTTPKAPVTETKEPEVKEPVEVEPIEEPVEEPAVGGWAKAEDTTVTEDLQVVLDKALEGLVGANYTAVAYLGSQVVAGTNHCYLCEITPVVPDAESHFGLVYLYEDLEGNVTLVNVEDLEIASAEEFDLEGTDIGAFYNYVPVETVEGEPVNTQEEAPIEGTDENPDEPAEIEPSDENPDVAPEEVPEEPVVVDVPEK